MGTKVTVTFEIDDTDPDETVIFEDVHDAVSEALVELVKHERIEGFGNLDVEIE